MKRKIPGTTILILIFLGLIGMGCVLYIYNYFNPPHYRQGVRLANETNLKDVDYCHIKNGFYCGEGGIDCNHGDGFIYFTENMTAGEAMNQAGFKYIKEEKEYNNGPDWAIIKKVKPYKDGFLLWYQITGEA